MQAVEPIPTNTFMMLSHLAPSVVSSTCRDFMRSCSKHKVYDSIDVAPETS